MKSQMRSIPSTPTSHTLIQATTPAGTHDHHTRQPEMFTMDQFQQILELREKASKLRTQQELAKMNSIHQNEMSALQTQSRLHATANNSHLVNTVQAERAEMKQEISQFKHEMTKATADNQREFIEITSNIVSNLQRTNNDNARESTPRNNSSNNNHGMCYDWRDGSCRRGDNCKFSHESDRNSGQRRDNASGFAKCRDFANGRCSRAKCSFSHDNTTNSGVCYATQQGRDCNNSDCNYIHHVKQPSSSPGGNRQSNKDDKYPPGTPYNKRACINLKIYKSCTRRNCQNSHDTDAVMEYCREGNNCRRTDCSFSHRNKPNSGFHNAKSNPLPFSPATGPNSQVITNPRAMRPPAQHLDNGSCPKHYNNSRGQGPPCHLSDQMCGLKHSGERPNTECPKVSCLDDSCPYLHNGVYKSIPSTGPLNSDQPPPIPRVTGTISDVNALLQQPNMLEAMRLLQQVNQLQTATIAQVDFEPCASCNSKEHETKVCPTTTAISSLCERCGITIHPIAQCPLRCVTCTTSHYGACQ